MRYLGNKTRLLGFLLEQIEPLDPVPGVACDPFAGTASVAAALKSTGWRTHAGDLLSSSYVLQVARVELDESPRFPGRLIGQPGTVSLERALSHLNRLPGTDGFVTEHYTPVGAEAGGARRMYFQPDNGRRIDTIRETISAWERDGLRPAAAGVLLASLIEAADRVANTTGVYASFVKSWQPNARRTLTLEPVDITAPRNGSTGSTAFLGPARERVASVGPVDLLYLDPPYNGRQYPGYYHIPELIADGWDPPPTLRGKTGLIPDEDRRSEWCRRRGANAAFRALLDVSDSRHILLSYNDEGLLSEEEIEAGLRARGDPDTYRMIRQPYRRYRSDSDGPARRYSGDSVHEQLFYIRAG